ncbi:DUF1007 family protein [Falsirhodobacter sp. alg1]|uniref:DUF1007 family protein n=1 Tax=Falsirhodobacter sp. alg1 TaxID=1472418 RepID=UPI00178CE1AB|nr:DUF1007 family protein [Falsirhodobacter sp. alg1]
MRVAVINLAAVVTGMFLRTLILCLVAAGPVTAHPHVFVDESVGFDVQNGSLVSLRIVWLYDAFTTLVMYDQLGLDENGDGILDASDMEKIVIGETDWEPGYEGDTYLFAGSRKVELGRPRNAAAQVVDGRAEVTFDLPLAKPLPMAGETATLKAYAPDYYYAYTVQEVLQAGENCTAEIQHFEVGALSQKLQDELALLGTDEMPDDPDIGANFAEQVHLRCQ